MTPSISLTCTACGAALKAGELVCPSCSAPVPPSGSGIDHVLPPPPVSPSHTDEMWAEAGARLAERTIGQYEILTELGRGGMAAVYLAHDILLNRHDALKVMSPAILTTEGMIARFRAEAQTQARLTHPNIVTVYSVGRLPDLHYFVMQYVPGRSLHQALQAEQAAGRPLSIAVVRSLLFQVGSALNYAHRKGVIHRDVKPGNVMMNADGDAVVTDFGIAKVTSNSSNTQTGTVVGTAAYMSPEQCYAAELTSASDQYALAIVAYELLTGRVPFVGVPFTVMQAHTIEQVPPIREKRPDCPADLDLALQRMLAKDPKDRFPDISAALVAMQAAPASGQADDAVRSDLIRLADVAGIQASLNALLRSPESPTPISKGQTPLPGPQQGSDWRTTPRSGSDVTPSNVAVLRLSEPPKVVEVGERFRLLASAHDPQGAPAAAPGLRWSSSNRAIVQVSAATGEMQAISPGVTDVVASVGEIVATARVVVVPASVASIVGVRVPTTVEVGETVAMVAQALDARGARVECAIAWSVRTPAVASITPAGALTARKAGAATVVASAEKAKGEFEIEIVPPVVTRIELQDMPTVVGAGESITVSALLQDKRGFEVSGRALRWRSSDERVVTVADGEVRGLSPGQATIEALCEGTVASSVVTVGVVPIAALEIKGVSPEIRSGSKKRLQMLAKDTRGRPRQLQFEWTSSNADVAVVDESHNLRGLAAGEAILSVRCGTLERSFPIVVRRSQPFVARVSGPLLAVAQRLPSMSLGGVSRKWLGIGALSVVLIAVATFAMIKVIGGPVDSLPPDDTTDSLPPPPPPQSTLQLVRPVSLQIEPGDTLTLQISSDGASASDSVRWSSSDSLRARVDSSGLVTAIDTGAVTITATAGALSDTVTLGIAYRVATLTIVKLDSVVIGQDTVMRVVARSASRKRVQPTQLVWSALQVNVATIDSATGRLHPISVGVVLVDVVDAYGNSARASVLVKEARAAEAQPPVRPSTPDPPPKTWTLSDALEPSYECRDAFVNLDKDRINQLGLSGNAKELKNQSLFMAHMSHKPSAEVTGTGGPNGDLTHAEVTFAMRLRWQDRNPVGLTRKNDEPFTVRAVLDRSNGPWKLVSCHIESVTKF